MRICGTWMVEPPCAGPVRGPDFRSVIFCRLVVDAVYFSSALMPPEPNMRTALL